MVDIRFRAWHKLKKRMYYDVQDVYCDIEFGDCFGDILKDANFEVMMYTGIKDNREVGITDDKDDEIHEGDIVAFEATDNIRGVGYVKWDDKKTMFLIDGGDIAFFDDIKNILVLGNIYEKPELLNKLHNKYRPKKI